MNPLQRALRYLDASLLFALRDVKAKIIRSSVRESLKDSGVEANQLGQRTPAFHLEQRGLIQWIALHGNHAPS